MVKRYRLKVSIPAILDKPARTQVQVKLSAGALLRAPSKPSTTLFGMTVVFWAGRHYSVYPRDHIQKAERVYMAREG